ncbi:MAG: NAD(+)/NADH kinase [Firmicutes bacterium]|nr:NAD(+)/NADH kinase [Bacillota bacterium]
MKIGIFSNLKRDIGAKSAILLHNHLESKGLSTYIWCGMKDIPHFKGLNSKFILEKHELARVADIMFVFGGDGTILKIVKECAENNTLIFGVNLGGMGYLTEAGREGFSEIFKEIESKNYILDERAILEAEFKGEVYYALNEAVVERGHKTKILKTEVKVNGVSAGKFNSDGVIVATPTGSTAYSLSAGGPIVAPDLEGFIIVPISPHSLNSRPVVASDLNPITITLLSHDEEAHLNLDGEVKHTLSKGDTVVIKKAPFKAKFIRLKGYNYYERLKEKMKEYR